LENKKGGGCRGTRVGQEWGKSSGSPGKSAKGKKKSFLGGLKKNGKDSGSVGETWSGGDRYWPPSLRHGGRKQRIEGKKSKHKNNGGDGKRRYMRLKNGHFRRGGTEKKGGVKHTTTGLTERRECGQGVVENERDTPRQ